MATCKSVVVVCPNARRQTVKVGPTTTILQILEEVCKKQGFSSQEHGIKHQRKILDETLPIRYSGLSNNAHLELVKHVKTSKQGVQCTIAIQLASGERLQNDFPPENSLWDLVSHWNSQEGSEHQNKLFGTEEQDVVCVYMTQRISGEDNLKKTTLHSLGLTGKRAIIRLLHEKASVETSEPMISEDKTSLKKQETSAENPQPTIPVTVPTPNTGNYCQPLSSGDKEIADLDRHRPLDTGTVSPERAASDPKRTRVTGPTPLFPDFKFPERPASEDQGQISMTEERLQQLSTPCERCPVIFNEDDQTLSNASEEDVPDSFYDVTVEDLRKMLQDLHSEKTKGAEMPLLTKAMRESRRLQEMYKYEKVVIRVKFPDRLTLQGFFRPQEKVSVLTEFVKSHLEDPDTAFYLYTTPPKTVLKNQEATLFASQLCPASLVYFGSSMKRDHFLSSTLIGNLKSALDAEKTVFEAGIRGPAEPQSTNTEHLSNTTANSTNGRPVGDVTSSARQAAQPTQAAAGSNAKVPKWFKGTGK
ncbi:tether containing UBX domain for GLUT4-like [Actinia tenebrosa]|uniref:Tether containing UBX domain for GLUT4-like n=1 Tax=Actinia tenebrosa TaxID=6105 RepID=A0A6P8IA33_ACTTE|nr:tether containing UBX domain for GLUT4-like [Actinia tenebrosa]